MLLITSCISWPWAQKYGAYFLNGKPKLENLKSEKEQKGNLEETDPFKEENVGYK